MELADPLSARQMASVRIDGGMAPVDMETLAGPSRDRAPSFTNGVVPIRYAKACRNRPMSKPSFSSDEARCLPPLR